MQQNTTSSMFTPIKVNLTLHIIGQTDYNYLLLDSFVVFSQTGDEVIITPSEQDNFTVNGPYSFQLQEENNNLVTQTRDLLRDMAKLIGKSSPFINIKLIKNLPVASGLGGGSGDAATTLILLDKIWNLNLPQNILLDLAKQLGADVPCCVYYLLNKTSLYMGGIGEIIEPINNLPKIYIVIVNSLEKTSTKEVCKNVQKKNNPPINRCYNFNNLEQFIAFLKQNRNDFLSSAINISPSIKLSLQELKKTALFSTMSGSGASCIGIFKKLSEAQETAKNIQERNPNWFVKATSF